MSCKSTNFKEVHIRWQGTPRRGGQLSNQLNFSYTDMFDNFIPSNRLPPSTQAKQIIELD